MPRAFSAEERDKIGRQMMEVGYRHFARSGVRAARISDICAAVGIAKGSFYNFFESKEDLFMAIANQRDNEHKSDLLDHLQTAQGDAKSILIKFFQFLRERIETDPLLAIVRDQGELQHLLRTVPAARHQENAQNDRKFMQDVADVLQARFQLAQASAAAFEELASILLCVTLQREHLSNTQIYENCIQQVQDMFVARLMKGPLDDHC